MNPATITYLRDADLAHRFHVSRATIWRWAASGDFPKPLRLSANCTRWRSADVEQWESERAPAGATA